MKGDDDMPDRVIETDMRGYRFMTNPYPRRPADWEGEKDHKAALAKMLSRVPRRAYPIGVFEQIIADRPGYTWMVEERFFLLRLRRRKHERAMFRISWDDNCGLYEWHTEVVGSGFASPKEAAEAMLRHLYRGWCFDVDEPEYEDQRDFLESVMRMELVPIGHTAAAAGKTEGKGKGKTRS